MPPFSIRVPAAALGNTGLRRSPTALYPCQSTNTLYQPIIRMLTVIVGWQPPRLYSHCEFHELDDGRIDCALPVLHPTTLLFNPYLRRERWNIACLFFSKGNFAGIWTWLADFSSRAFNHLHHVYLEGGRNLFIMQKHIYINNYKIYIQKCISTEYRTDFCNCLSSSFRNEKWKLWSDEERGRKL